MYYCIPWFESLKISIHVNNLIFFHTVSLRSVKSIQHALRSTEELWLGSVSFELSVVVTHQTKACRGSMNLYALLWKQVFRLLWISSKEEMSFKIVECKLCRLISHSISLIRKMWHLLEKTKGICTSKSETSSEFEMVLLHLVSYISVKHLETKAKKLSHLIYLS